MLAFTQIDRSDPEKEYSVAIVVNDDDVYRVTSCVPDVDDMDELVSELNATNNFSRFVQKVRCSFVGIVDAAAEDAET